MLNLGAESSGLSFFLFPGPRLLDPATKVPPCTGVFSITMGLPCVHKVQGRMRANQCVEVNDFHLQWRLNWLQDLLPLSLTSEIPRK
jgi:hypothetical protein